MRKILKKKTAPKYNSNSLSCKKHQGKSWQNSKNFHWLKKKLDLEWTMYKLGKTIKTKSFQKSKNSKNQCQNDACGLKPQERLKFRSNTVFSLYFKIRAKNITPQNHSLFCSTSCFGMKVKCGGSRSPKKEASNHIRMQTMRTQNPKQNWKPNTNCWSKNLCLKIST